MLVPRSFLPLAALSLLAAGAWAQDDAAERRAELDANAQETLEKLFANVDGSQALYDESAGYAVFAATKAGFGIAGGGGAGVAVDKSAGSSTYMRMGTAGVGFSFGAQRYDIVMLFQSAQRLQNFVSGGWDGGAAAEAMAGADSAGAGVGFIDGAAVFTLTNAGAMASANVSGTRFWVAEDLN